MHLLPQNGGSRLGYAPGRHGSHAMDILRGFEGILQVDGYTGYNALAEPGRVGGKPLTLAYC